MATDLGNDQGASDSLGSVTASTNVTFTIPGEYTVCYKIATQTGGSWFNTQVGTNLAVSAVKPESFTANAKTAGSVTTGSAITVSFAGGAGLNLAANGDAMKIVNVNDTCDSTAAGGTSVVTDLSNADSNSENAIDATSAVGDVTFTTAGVYKVCYKLAAESTFSTVAGSITTISVGAVMPTDFSAQTVTAGTAALVTLSSGSGLHLGEYADSFKVVGGTRPCTDDAAGGTSVVTDLGGGDNNDATEATASLTFTTSGTYKLCYKLDAANAFVEVGSGTTRMTVVGVGPTEFTIEGGGVSMLTGIPRVITMTGGKGLNLAADSFKSIETTSTCDVNDAAGVTGTTLTVPANSNPEVTASTTVTFTQSGEFQLCYKPALGSWARVGSDADVVYVAATQRPTGSPTSRPTGSPTMPTPAPTPAPTPPHKVKQTASYSHLSVDQFDNATATVFNTGYGIVLRIYNATTKTWKAGCDVTSVASASPRRGGIDVAYEASVHSDSAADATTAAHSADPAAMVSAISQAAAVVDIPEGSTPVVVPTASDIAVAAPVVIVPTGAPTRMPTGSPTPAPTQPYRIEQTVVFTNVASGSFTGALKTVYEQGYGLALQIFSTGTSAFADQCSVTSTVTYPAGGKASVVFTALVQSGSKSDNAVDAASNLAKGTLSARIGTVAANVNGVTAPTPGQIESISGSSVVEPTAAPTLAPTTTAPTVAATGSPTGAPTTAEPSVAPTDSPTTGVPTVAAVTKKTHVSLVLSGYSETTFTASVQTNFKDAIAEYATVELSKISELDFVNARRQAAVQVSFDIGSTSDSAATTVADRMTGITGNSDDFITVLQRNGMASVSGVSVLNVVNLNANQPPPAPSAPVPPPPSLGAVAGSSGSSSTLIIVIVVVVVVLLLACLGGAYWYFFSRGADEPASGVQPGVQTTQPKATPKVEEAFAEVEMAEIKSAVQASLQPQPAPNFPDRDDQPDVFINLDQLHDFGDDPGVPEGDPGMFDPSDPTSYPDTVSPAMAGLLEAQIEKHDDEVSRSRAASQATGTHENAQMGAGVDFGEIEISNSMPQATASSRFDMDLGQAADEYNEKYSVRDPSTAVDGPYDMRTHAMQGDLVASSADLHEEEEDEPSHTAVVVKGDDSDDEDVAVPTVATEQPPSPPDTPGHTQVAVSIMDEEEVAALAALDDEAVSAPVAVLHDDHATNEMARLAELHEAEVVEPAAGEPMADFEDSADVAVAPVEEEEEAPQKWNL